MTVKSFLSTGVLAALTVVPPLGDLHAEARPQVQLSGVALDVDDDNRFFMRTGGTVRDTISYEGLLPGQDYTLVGQLHHLGDGQDVGAPVYVSFVAESADGVAQLELPVPANRTSFNIDYAVHVTLLKGRVGPDEAADAAELAQIVDNSSPERVIQVHAIQRVKVSASDAADGDQRLDGQGGTIRARIAHENLVPGYSYTLWGELMKPSGQSTGIYASIAEYVPEQMNDAVTLDFVVPAGFEGVQLVPSIGLYHKKRVQFDQRGTVVPLADAPNPVMIASDPDLERADKTIAIGVLFEEQPES
ncbi:MULTISPECIES: VaFE repeat-containing surface-anchored protein [unclassified Paracoccus (in: a-proteobacteria)]|uniref:VaFE repeat-containing surface-anchored protein n=1 Tax=unclassified Paracoccus (in: a-proteobacteria) TaxID=2688777 RepID=UPI0018A6C42F|nr:MULTISPECIES: VaFE repeat-containing surface-anchored protein [unclassified Paracoccus (in: a-proteobacteria)]UXU73856.1 VaFE repeat-containing surface-anchored protein [Paracoccus sp. SMMA_5]UXU79744.1 VaFE repeat-containing surface-anchored protein [Paracoccus sp. SMMA_5_TC]